MKEIDAKQASELMQKDPEIIYLDVRSVPEFEQGHPPNAFNIPLLHFSPGSGMYPNEDFERVLNANLSKNAQILVGCQSGGRSARACEIMSSLGYSNVTNVSGGFGGAMDQMGRVTEPGWSMLGLPVCQECKEDSHYDALSKATDKKS
jgi:rhodanese-related sulfurtransferase